MATKNTKSHQKFQILENSGSGILPLFQTSENSTANGADQNGFCAPLIGTFRVFSVFRGSASFSEPL
jgi:hypothetical protein